jgi:hypothetical protein
MAIVKGARRANPKVKAAKQRWDVTRQRMGVTLGQRWCPWCKPGHWVREAQWDAHYQQVAFRLDQERQARAVEKAAAKVKPPPPRPERSKNSSKPAPAAHPAQQKEHPVSQPTSNGTQPARQQMSGAAPEGVAEAFRMWAIVVPPSIPAARFDAQAMADAYRLSADALRLRVRMEQEHHNLPELILEPMLQAATMLSQLGDQHMEVVRRLEIRYGQIAEVLARPDTPDFHYLSGGK